MTDAGDDVVDEVEADEVETDEVDDTDDVDDVDDADEPSGNVADAPSGNQVSGAVARNVLEFLAKELVDHPDAVRVEVEDSRGRLTLRLHVADGDMGQVIGRRGRIAQSIRAVVRAAGAREGVDANVDIVD